MKKAILAASILTFCAPVLAQSGEKHNSYRCRAWDMNGEWVAYQGTVAVPPGGKLHTGVCEFTVSNGTANGTCEFNDANPAPFFSGPFQGQVTVSPDCAVELTMDFAPAPFVSTFYLQMNKDKKSFVGRWANTAGAFGTSNGVKR